MNDKDKWSAHLEYLKVAITLSTAILAVAAAIYSDSAKIPGDASKYALLASAIFVFLTLVTSIMGVIYLSNYLIRATTDTADAQGKKARKITYAAGASFFSFLATGACILAFFLMRTFSSAVVPPARALENVATILKGQFSATGERLVFQRFEVKGSKYLVEYLVGQGPRTFRATLDANTGQVESIEGQP
jgi:hypothetical protein